MKIVLKEDANLVYHRTLPRHLPINWEWANILELLAGKEVEVDTKFLFNDQFNTLPYQGELNQGKVNGRDYGPALEKIRKGNGLRIMAHLVKEVIEEDRIGKMRCQYCGQTNDVSPSCPSCKKDDYLTVFTKNNIKPEAT